MAFISQQVYFSSPHPPLRRPSICCTSAPSKPDPSHRSSFHSSHPVAFSSPPGPTGTVCIPLYPLPYVWFLTVYRRDIPSKHGPFTIHLNPSFTSLSLRFSQSRPPLTSFSGIAAFTVNILSRLSKLPSPLAIQRSDKSAKQPFFSRQNHFVSAPFPVAEGLWAKQNIIYTKIREEQGVEIRQVREGSENIQGEILKWFAMGLWPIWPLWDYACFVCVWKSGKEVPQMAMDRGEHGGVRLSWVRYEEGLDGKPLGIVAVKVFYGSVMDGIVEEQRKLLVEGVRKMGMKVLEKEGVRISMENSHALGKRKNEMWMQVVPIDYDA